MNEKTYSMAEEFQGVPSRPGGGVMPVVHDRVGISLDVNSTPSYMDDLIYMNGLE